MAKVMTGGRSSAVLERRSFISELWRDLSTVSAWCASRFARVAARVRALALESRHHDDLHVAHSDRPAARAELRHPGLAEFLLLFGDRSEACHDPFFQITRNLVAAAPGLHPFPVMHIVEML